MYLGALAEAITLVTLLLSVGHIQSATRAAAIGFVGPHAAPAVTKQAIAKVASILSVTVTIDVVVLSVAIAGWLVLAWANGRGAPLARVGAIVVCALYTALTIPGLSGDARYVPAALLAASCAVMAIGIAAVVLLLVKQSWPYYADHATAM